MYSYINYRKASIVLEGDVALNARTVTPPVCTIPDIDNHNLKWHTAICNVCSLSVAAESSYPVIRS